MTVACLIRYATRQHRSPPRAWLLFGGAALAPPLGNLWLTVADLAAPTRCAASAT